MLSFRYHRYNPVPIALLLCVCCAAQVSFAQGTTQLEYNSIDASQFPVIVSGVSLRGPDFLTIGGLTQNDFSVYEDGVLQTPIQVEAFGGDSGGVSIAIVIDRSGSMEEEEADMKLAATTFVSYMRDFDQAALVTFCKQVTVDVGFTNDRAALTDAINAIDDLCDGTSVFDGVMKGLDLLDTVTGRKAVVLLTDGADTQSKSTVDDVVLRLTGSGVPVIAIALGMLDRDEMPLRQMADASRGRFYETPNSGDLQAIYQLIAYLLFQDKWYRITYTTSNCTMDGTTRQVRIDARYSGQTYSATNSYVAPGYFATVAFAADSLPMPGKSFRLRLEIPTQSPDVLGLFELDAVIKYDSRYLQVKQPVNQNVQIGPLFGSPVEYTFTTNSTIAGELGLQVKRKAGFGRITGRGVIAEITFVASAAMPDSTELLFEFVSFDGKNDAGCGVALQSQNLTLYSYGLVVWPGDTNHNGAVELTDVTVLGIHWEIDGPPRTGPEDQNAWMAHLAGRFVKVAATHADANGTGRIDERDLFPIGLNWRKTSANPDLPKVAAFQQAPDGTIGLAISQGSVKNEYLLSIRFENANQAVLAGFALRMNYPREVTIQSHRLGEAWGSMPLVFALDNEDSRLFAWSAVIPSGSATTASNGNLVQVVLHSEQAPNINDFNVHDLAVLSPSGEMRELVVSSSDDAGAILPTEFWMSPAYPNPFGGAATPAKSVAVEFHLTEPSQVQVKIFNTAGQQVLQSDMSMAQGKHSFHWNGADHSGAWPSGLYFIQVQAQGESGRVHKATQRVLKMR